MWYSKRPLRALILTSIRDVGACDFNGSVIPTRAGPRYMEGVVERAVRECGPRGELHGLLEIAGIVTDDLPQNLCSCKYPLRPAEGLQWIHPLDLEDHRGKEVCAQTTHIPSTFRAISAGRACEKRDAKREFECSIRDHMNDIGADIIISDHYMAKIEFLIGEFGLYGRVLNIHPAITDTSHPCCFRGPTPTADAIAAARSGKSIVTGATLHVVNEKFDDGPIIDTDAPTPVWADDTPQELRWRNYQAAKLPVFVRGMQKYVATL